MLPNVTYCRDLGVIITSDLSSTQYITEIVSKAHQRANCILRSFTSGDIGLLLRAFIVYVRPIFSTLHLATETDSCQSCEPLRQILRFSYLHGFSGSLDQKWRFLGVK